MIVQIISQYPIMYTKTSQLQISENLTLADPTFDHPGTIDVLLGATAFWELLFTEPIRLNKG